RPAAGWVARLGGLPAGGNPGGRHPDVVPDLAPALGVRQLRSHPRPGGPGPARAPLLTRRSPRPAGRCLSPRPACRCLSQPPAGRRLSPALAGWFASPAPAAGVAPLALVGAAALN